MTRAPAHRHAPRTRAAPIALLGALAAMAGCPHPTDGAGALSSSSTPGAPWTVINESSTTLDVQIEVSPRNLACETIADADAPAVAASVLPPSRDTHSVPDRYRNAAVVTSLSPGQCQDAPIGDGQRCAAARITARGGAFERRVLVRAGEVYTLRGGADADSLVLVDARGHALSNAAPPPP